MANEYNIQMNQFNGTDYDNLYPVTFSPSTGQLFNNATSDDEIFQYIGNKLQNIDQIGSIQLSTRNDLDNTWLLCNGDNISETEYPELAQVLVNFVPSAEWKLINNLPFKFNEMIFDGTYYIGVGQQVSAGGTTRYSGVLAYSTSLEGPWTTVTVFPEVYYFGNLYSVMYDGTYYIVAGGRYYGNNYDAIIAYSTSLSGSWTIKTIYYGSKSSRILHIDYINGQYILSGSKNDGDSSSPNSDITTILSYSSDITGSFANVTVYDGGNNPSQINNVVYGNGYYMCPGSQGSNVTGYYYATSLNGPWTFISKYSRGSSGIDNKAIFVNNNFLYPGGGGVLYYGADPTSLSSVNMPQLNSRDVNISGVINYYNYYICSINTTGDFGIAYNSELNQDTSNWKTNSFLSLLGGSSLYRATFNNLLVVNNNIIMLGTYQNSYGGTVYNTIVYNNIRLPILTSNECYYYIKAKEDA